MDQQIKRIVHYDDGDSLELVGTGYAVRCAAAIAESNIPDALWALEVLSRYGHLVKHGADRHAAPATPVLPVVKSPRERLEDERWRLENSYGNGSFQDGVVRMRIESIDQRVAEVA